MALHSVARRLGVHPFELARLSGHLGEVPAGLVFDSRQVRRLESVAGAEEWWKVPPSLSEADPARTDELGKLLLAMLVERGFFDRSLTRADNLFRGLSAADQARARRLINWFIRQGWMRSRTTWKGLMVSLDPERRAEVMELVEGRSSLGLRGPPGSW
jgi:hypothetical protein